MQGKASDMKESRPSNYEAGTAAADRRTHLQLMLGAFVSFALLGESAAVVPTRRRLAPRLWVDRQNEIARALSTGQIRPGQWMDEVERLAREIELDQLLKLLAKAEIKDGGTPFHNDPQKRYVRFLDEDGTPRRLAYGAAFFDFSPTNVVTPHGHKHMVSAHLVVDGRFRVRNFDRLRDEGDAIVIRPTRDYVARPGQVSTMSSERDNIHWFVPQGGPARTFDVVISGLDEGAPDHEIKAIDPLRGRKLADDAIVAPIIEFGASSAKYTADV